MLYRIHSDYGILPWNKVVEPAIRLAENGFYPPNRLIKSLKKEKYLWQIEENNDFFKEIRDNLLMLEKKDDGDLGIDLLKDYIKNNYKGFSDDNLKFANRFWLNQKNKDFREISKVWLEILSDDQHIKSLERDIQDNKSKISNEDDERRFIELIKDRDNSIKSIEEKYGKEESQ